MTACNEQPKTWL